MNTTVPVNGSPMTPQPRPDLRSRLLERVRASQAHESQFLTVRRDGLPWSLLAAAVRHRPLARTGLASSCLIELGPHAIVPRDPCFTQAELVVLGGEAVVVGNVDNVGNVASAASVDKMLACGEAACLPHDLAHPIHAGAAGARLFLRLSAPDVPAASLTHFSAVRGDGGWDDFCPGVRIRALWQGGERSSLLVRMRAGASVNAHGHPLEEECMMLAGEAFVGDTLLRSSDYQLAPMGSRHGAVTTDVGALFYVHGSLNPAAYL